MTRTLIAFMLGWLFYLPVNAQDADLQQLLSLKDDTVKVQKLIDYGRDIMDIDPVAAEDLFDTVISISNKINYQKGAGQGWMGVGYINGQQGTYQVAIDAYSRAAGNLKAIGMINRATQCMNVIGTIYDFLGHRDSAIQIYMQSAQLLENTPYLSSLGSTYCYIGVLHQNSNDFNKAVAYLVKSVDYLRRAKDTVYLIESLTELSDTYSKMKQPAKALPLAEEALQLSHYLNRFSFSGSVLSTAYYSNALAHLEMGNTALAISNARLSMEYAERSNDINTFIGGALVLSDCYEKNGDQRSRYGVLEKAAGSAEKTGNIILLHDIYLRLHDAAFHLGNFKEAYQYQKTYLLYKDSLFSKQNLQTISELEVKYQTSQKEKDLSEKKLQLQRSRQVIYGSLGSLVIALLLIGFLYFFQKNRKKVHQREIRALRQEKELHLLQAIMQGEEKERSRIAKDLHDGVAGMLAAVKMHFSSIQTGSTDFADAEGYIQGMKLLNEATQEIRKTSHNLMPEVLLQHGLDEALRRYCTNVNNSRILQIQYDSWGLIDRFVDGFELSVYRIVQELLNNIVKHSKASQAMVQLTEQDDLLSISIEDNGVGFNQDQYSSEGMGLRSLMKRIQAMNGKMELQASEQTGVSAYLEFDVSDLKKTIEEEQTKNAGDEQLV